MSGDSVASLDGHKVHSPATSPCWAFSARPRLDSVARGWTPSRSAPA